MKARVVIGANLGDEGKGTVVAHYTKHADGNVLNVLTNGGPQRAHSILTEEGSFTFQHFGSGTYHGADNYFSKYFIVNPFVFVDEYKRLTDKGVSVSKIYRDPECRWSTPWDMMANQIKEELRKDNRHGSCGMGIWDTVCRYNKTITVSFDTFMGMEPAKQKSWLINIREYHERNLEIPNHWKEIFLSEAIIDNFIADCKIFSELTTTIALSDCIGYSEVIFENGQGLLLSDIGIDIPGTTPSKTGFECVLGMIGSVRYDTISTHYVTRPYITRHGRGDFFGEAEPSKISTDIKEDRTNHYNEFQERFRYGNLSVESLLSRIKMDGGINPVLEITHCDEMDRVSEFKKYFSDVNTYDSALVK